MPGSVEPQAPSVAARLRRKDKCGLHGYLAWMPAPGQTLSCEDSRGPGCDEPWGVSEIASVARCLLGSVNVRGALEGNECSVSTGQMKYEPPRVPWKPDWVREKLKEDSVKVPRGPGEVGLGLWVLSAGGRRCRSRASAGQLAGSDGWKGAEGLEVTGGPWRPRHDARP